jgi:1,4-alpha-glucan branching enzyme
MAASEVLPRSPDRGHLVLFLHAHLPFVRPVGGDALEGDWLFDAITETYLPLLRIAEGWRADGIPARITVSLSPPLLEMLRDELLMARYVRRLHMLLEFVDHELFRTAAEDQVRMLAVMYRRRLEESLDMFEVRYKRDLVAAFAQLQSFGVLELVTSCATHAYLPGFDSGFARGQIRLGLATYQEHFGCLPRGMWLPECGFVPGLDRLLAAEGIEYFCVDSHGVELADPSPLFGTRSPVVCPSGVVAFPRDPSSSSQVWSADVGYPGDGRYREFYRDVGWDLDDTSISPFRLAGGEKRSIGIKYHRVTSRATALGDKALYDRFRGLQAADEHARAFVSERSAEMKRWRSEVGRPAIVMAPYDAELFGHWWFEGPEFLDRVVRESELRRDVFSLSTPGEILDSDLDLQVATPAPSSWGAHGYSETWLNDTTEWVWPLLHRASAEMARTAAQRLQATGLERRALNQLARELALAASSDWPFLITMGTMSAYAEVRLRTHIDQFDLLMAQVLTGRIDPDFVASLEAEDTIFPHIDYRDFAEPVSVRLV